MIPASAIATDDRVGAGDFERKRDVSGNADELLRRGGGDAWTSNIVDFVIIGVVVIAVVVIAVVVVVVKNNSLITECVG